MSRKEQDSHDKLEDLKRSQIDVPFQLLAIISRHMRDLSRVYTEGIEDDENLSKEVRNSYGNMVSFTVHIHADRCVDEIMERLKEVGVTRKMKIQNVKKVP